MTPLDALKAGLNSAIFVFLIGLLGGLTGVLNELVDYFSDRDPIDLSVARATLLALSLALAVGVLNALIRYVQVAGPAFVTKVLGSIFGAAPAYPEPHVAKALDATKGTATTSVDVRVDQPPIVRADDGQMSVGLVLTVVAVVLAAFWLFGVDNPFLD